ncbi:hypothetical protein [Sulfuricurvum sp.]|uniref:hypothetical protein n=1 Tax=Sulfuricurvum sp. TaxID=2025608 RepID=UPI003566EC99
MKTKILITGKREIEKFSEFYYECKAGGKCGLCGCEIPANHDNTVETFAILGQPAKLVRASDGDEMYTVYLTAWCTPCGLKFNTWMNENRKKGA